MEIVVHSIVEGDGEVHAVPSLIQKITRELNLSESRIQTPRPVILPRSQFGNEGKFKQRVHLTQTRYNPLSILVVLADADDAPTCLLGPQLRRWAEEAAGHGRICVRLAEREYESWFIAAAASLVDRGLLNPVTERPPNHKEIRGAKEWIRNHLNQLERYSPLHHQKKLTSAMDLAEAREHSRSLDKLCRDLEAAVLALAASQV